MKSLLVALFSLPTVSFACIWLDGTTLEGERRRYSEIISFDDVFAAMKKTPGDKWKNLATESPIPTDETAKQEREAVEVMLKGDPAAAVRKLQAIEQAFPGKYSIAANLGTAYELAGDNENALKWIRTGIARNQDSHQGTEWLHQLILEAKIRLASNPDFLKSHRIIPLPEKFDRNIRVKISGDEHSVYDIAFALNYQLQERLIFVKPPDPVVADLLFTYALIEARLNAVEGGIKLLALAHQYGFADPSLLAQTAEKYASAVNSSVGKPVKRKK